MAILTSDDGKIKMTLTEGASIPKANINSESVKDVILSVKNGSDIKVQAVTSPMSLGSNITINATWDRYSYILTQKLQINGVDIDFNNTSGITLPPAIGTFDSPSIIIVKNDSQLPGVSLFFGATVSGNPYWNNARMCYALKTNTRANRLCQQFTRKKTPDNTDAGTNKYRF